MVKVYNFALTHMKNLILWIFSVIIFFGLAGELVTRTIGYTPLQFLGEDVPSSDSNWGKQDSIVGWVNNPGIHKSVEPGHALMTYWEHARRASQAKSIDPSESKK